MLDCSALLLVATLSGAPAVQAPPPKSDIGFRVALITVAAVAGGDIATTAQASERGGLRELNPLFRPIYDRPVLLGLANGALSAGVGMAMYDLHRKGHPKLARIVTWTWAAFRGYVVYRNVRELGKGKR